MTNEEDFSWYLKSVGKDDLLPKKKQELSDQVLLLLHNDHEWKTANDAVHSFREMDPEAFDLEPFKSSLRAIYIFNADMNVFKLKIGAVYQDFEELAKNIKVKTFVARANPEKGGMLPLDSMHKIQLVNPNIVFKDFDTAHSVKTEMPEQYFDFLKELIV